jgi:hypothetical protein
MTVSDAYSAVPWQTFLAAEVGAGASLTGLLFVAVSINLERILSFPKLPARAAETLTLLLMVVVIASLELAPQSPAALAAEVIACAGGTAAVVLTVVPGPDRHHSGPRAAVPGRGDHAGPAAGRRAVLDAARRSRRVPRRGLHRVGPAGGDHPAASPVIP